MTGAELLLLINIVMTALFGASFAAVALITRQPRIFWFAAAYGVGTLTPLSEFLLPLTPFPAFFALTSYGSFLAGPMLIPVGLAAVHGAARPWRAYWAILGTGVAIRLALWGMDRDSFAYQLAYQLPFALGALLGCRTVLRLPERRTLYVAIGVLYGLIALQFAAKPFLAVAFGSGRTAMEYTRSLYAVISQASTAVLLVAAGLLVLLLVVQRAIGEAHAASETDALSGLANRRGFDRQAELLLARAAREQLPVSAILFDLDHFKAINDRFGHAMGDSVIAAFGTLLRSMAPRDAIVGRTGGEEFAMLLPGADGVAAERSGDAIRLALSELGEGPLPRVTVSGGVAEWERRETLAELVRRADAAAYRAKNSGRDRVCRDAGTRLAIVRSLAEPDLLIAPGPIPPPSGGMPAFVAAH
jgi:diguanylate cyclase (GGDEF)-like protein